MKLRVKVDIPVDNDDVSTACKEIIEQYGDHINTTTAGNYIAEIEDATVVELCNTFHDLATELEAWYCTVYAIKRS